MEYIKYKKNILEFIKDLKAKPIRTIFIVVIIIIVILLGKFSENYFTSIFYKSELTNIHMVSDMKGEIISSTTKNSIQISKYYSQSDNSDKDRMAAVVLQAEVDKRINDNTKEHNKQIRRQNEVYQSRVAMYVFGIIVRQIEQLAKYYASNVGDEITSIQRNGVDLIITDSNPSMPTNFYATTTEENINYKTGGMWKMLVQIPSSDDMSELRMPRLRIKSVGTVNETFLIVSIINIKTVELRCGVKDSISVFSTTTDSIYFKEAIGENIRNCVTKFVASIIKS